MRIAAVLLIDARCVPQSSAHAWGFEAHKFIAEQMIALLPAELRPLFEHRKAYIIERSVDPDLWRTVGWETEDPHHFLDLDYFGKYPFDELPREYDRAVQKFGRERDPRAGAAAVADRRRSTGESAARRSKG